LPYAQEDAVTAENIPEISREGFARFGRHWFQRRPMTAIAEYAPRRTSPVATSRQLDPERLGDHFDRLYRAAWALCGSREDAEDLVQETYAQVLRKRRFLRETDDLGYLLRVLRNTYVSRLRAAGRRVRTEAMPDDFEQLEDHSAPTPPDVLESREVYEVIAELPQEFREALVAVDVLGLSYREAARSLRTREATITTRLYRARRRVAERLGGKESGGLDVSPGEEQ
jgi:RNA polymerase sigma-70 factor (ECF subfamily)